MNRSGIAKFLLSLLLVVALDASSQNKSSSLIDLWATIAAQEDYEKNYRLPAFIDSLKEVELPGMIDSLPPRLPSEWSFAVDADTSLVIMAGVLAYELEPDRLIWMVQQRGESFNVEVFTTQLAAVSEANIIPKVQLETYEIDSARFVSLSVFVGSTRVLDLPDVYTKLVLQSLVNSSDDHERLLISQQLWARMELLLGYAPLFGHDFAGFEQVSTLQSADGEIKIVTWNVALGNGTNIFKGAVAVNMEGEVQVHELLDAYQTIKNPEQASLSPSKWFGAVYYEMIQNTYRGDTFYTLLGYNPNNPFSKIRVIEVMSLTKIGIPRFGNAIFEIRGRSQRRMVLEYSNRVSMMLRYDADEKMIVMDNLVPSAPMFQNDYRHYGPDFTHNALKFEKGKWIYIDNVEFRNSPNR